MSCYLCLSDNYSERPGMVRDNQALKVLECQDCGLVYLSSTKHADEQFYENSGMHAGEVAIEEWVRNTEADDQRRFDQLRNSLPNQRLLDFGCGNGAFLMLAKRLCAEVVGVELERRLQSHFQANGLQVFQSLDDVKGEFDWITAFHVIEHLPDPVKVLRQLATRLKPESGRMVIEVPSSDDALLNQYNCVPFQNFTYWSCHLYLFNPATLRKLASLAGLKVEMIRQVQRYPLANHLYWLAHGRPGGHKAWPFLNTPALMQAYEAALAGIGACDTISAVLLRQ